MVIDGKHVDAGSASSRGHKKTFSDDLHSTFSSPLAWILVLALIITWSCVFVIMFDLMDYKTVSGKERLAVYCASLYCPLRNRCIVEHLPSQVRQIVAKCWHTWLCPGTKCGPTLAHICLSDWLHFKGYYLGEN